MAALKTASAPVSRAQFKDHTDADKHWIIIDSNVYDVSCWLQSHPGGKLILLHSIGRDVSEAFNAYHPHWVRQQLAAFKVGQLQTDPRDNTATAQALQPSVEPEVATKDADPCDMLQASSMSSASQDAASNPQIMYSLLQQGTQQKVAASHRLKTVEHALDAAGLFHTSPGFYCKLAACCALCLALAVWCVVHQYIMLGALLLGLFWQQVCSSLILIPQHCCPTCKVTIYSFANGPKTKTKELES